MVLADQGAEHGNWKDDTFKAVIHTVGWDSRADPRFEIKTGQEGPYMGDDGDGGGDGGGGGAGSGV